MEWTQFAIFFIGVFGLWLWNRTESRADARETRQMIFAIQQEMKDFHGRLEKQDAEFKAFMRGIEQERNRKLFIKD